MNLLRKLIVGATILGLCLSVIPLIPATVQASQEVQDKKVNESKSKTGDQIINPMTAITEWEPNNSFSDSNYMTVDDYMQAYLSSGDEDYFIFWAPVTGSYTMYSTGSTDTDAALFNTNREYVWDSWGTGNFSITRNLTQGWYYLKVHSYSQSTGSYNILISHPQH